MKAGLAAALIACRDAARSGLAGDVAVAAVADEEHASLGVQEAVAALAAAAGAPAGGVDGAIVTEPTELALVVAHKGFAWQEVTVTGRAAHGSRPDLGVDAILESAPILAGLSALDAGLAERPHPLLGRGSLHASLIEGGRELSTYPDRCVLTLERRTLPGESTADVERELDELLARCRSADPQLEAAARTLLVREPFAVDPGAQIVRAVGDAAAAVRGSVPEQHGAPFWTDAAFIAAAGIPTVLFGPAGAGAHATEEWVAVDSLLQTTEVLRRTAAAFCA
jgi:acetylornithine deacetylase